MDECSCTVPIARGGGYGGCRSADSDIVRITPCREGVRVRLEKAVGCMDGFGLLAGVVAYAYCPSFRFGNILPACRPVGSNGDLAVVGVRGVEKFVLHAGGER